MATWYDTGTVTVTNNSATVSGSGTAWVANVLVGEAFIGPDGRTYEITAVASNTSMTIAPNYLGTNQSGQAYTIVPVRGIDRQNQSLLTELITNYQSVVLGIGAGLFPDGSAEVPGFRFANDQDTGIYRVGNNVLGFATAGAVRAAITAAGGFTVGTLTDPGAGNIGLVAGGRVQFSPNAYITPENNSTGAEISTPGAITFRTGSGVPARVRIDGLGRIGIGALLPTTPLDIQSDHTGTIIQMFASISDGNSATMRVLCSLPGVSFGGGALAHNLNGLGQVVVNGAHGSGAVHFADNGDIRFWSGARNAVAAVRLILAGDGSALYPDFDNATSLGASSKRFSLLYAGTGTINTSDEREKRWRGPLNAAELRAAKRIIGELGIYQWNDAVAEKGEDNARLHFGVRAQQAFAIMEDEGLDPGCYAWACYDQWQEQTEAVMEEVAVPKTRKAMRPSSLIDPATGQRAMVEVDEAYEETEMQPTGETRVTLEAGDRYGVRPDQLAFWLIAAQAKIQDDLEARLAALEAA